MAIIKQKRILNLIPKTSAPITIHVSQGDKGATIEFTLVNGDEEFTNTGNLTATVHGVRSDGAHFGAYECSLSGSKVSFKLKQSMTAVEGAALAEIELVNSSNEKVGSSNFAIMVEDAAFPLGVTYSNDVSVYESILAYVQSIPATLESEISTLNEHIEDVTKLAISGKNLQGSLILNNIYNHSLFSYYPQGAAYVKDDYVVVYYATNTSDIGWLVCYNISDYTEKWRYRLELCHGNSITYNPNNNMLYISACYTTNPITYVNRIFEINFDKPSIIKRTISLPNANMNYSLAYDVSTRQFYAINAIGSTEGVSNLLTIYNEDLTAIVRQVLCEDYPSVKYNLDTQGVQIGVNGVAYVQVYGKNFEIVGYDVATGKKVNVFNVPEYASDCRKIYEPEALMYDPVTHKCYMVGASRSIDIGIRSYYAMNIIELDVFIGVENQMPIPSIHNEENMYAPRLYCMMKVSALKPTFYTTRDYVDVPQDACNYCRLHGFLWVQFPLDMEVDTAYRLDLNGLKIRLHGSGSSDHIKISELNVCDADVGIWYADFVDSFKWASPNLYTNVRFGVNCNAYLQGCTFEDNSAGHESDEMYHLVAYWNSYISTKSVTYEGSYAHDTIADRSMINGVYS